MIARSHLMAFSASNDLARAKHFYHEVLGQKVVEENSMVIVFDAAGTQLRVSRVEKPVIAPYTVLGWRVSSISKTVADLTAKAITFERFAGLSQDAAAIATFPNGDRVAWFKDPDGHVLSLTEFAR